MLKIAIVDDHRLFRKSLALLVSSFSGIEVVIEAENGKIFLEYLKHVTVDIVLLDIQMPEMDGYETCQQLQMKYPNVRILILSQLSSKEIIQRTMELGAHGYFTKNSDPAQLELAIKSVDEKGFYFGSEMGSIIREIFMWEKKGVGTYMRSVAALSTREIEIIKMASQEKSSQEIAESLFINIRTVETHRKRIMEKTNSKNFIGVILFALRHRYLSLTDL